MHCCLHYNKGRVTGKMSDKCVLKRAYYNPPHPGSLGGVERLRREVYNEEGKQITVSAVKDFLSEQDT